MALNFSMPLISSSRTACCTARSMDRETGLGLRSAPTATWPRLSRYFSMPEMPWLSMLVAPSTWATMGPLG